MYEITFKTKELGAWKCLATYSQAHNSYIDEQGFLLNDDIIIWVEKI